jgi:hypothetical protein
MKLWNLPIAVYLFVVFVSGGVVGALGYRMYSPPPAHSEQRLTPEAWRKQYLEELRTRVGLTPDQLEKMNVIMDHDDASFLAARDQHHQEMERIKEEHRAKLRSMLTPDQLPKYEQFRAERDARMKTSKK